MGKVEYIEKLLEDTRKHIKELDTRQRAILKDDKFIDAEIEKAKEIESKLKKDLKHFKGV